MLLSFNEAFLYSALLFFLTISNLYSRMKVVPNDTKLNTVPGANLLSFFTIIDDTRSLIFVYPITVMFYHALKIRFF